MTRKENTVSAACADECVALSGRRWGKWENRIASLPLLCGLSTATRARLLRRARLHDFVKGGMLFLEGEAAKCLYIVLAGWIKILKSSTDGEQTVLQMLGAGDTVLESAVFLNIQFSFSAQVAEEASVLSIPAPGLREYIKQDEQLARNFLLVMAHASHAFVHQMGNARMKTVEERIGCFLLGQFLEQGRSSRAIKLPYDKSVIAAQLNMRRETFSRVLSAMKKDGLRMEKHTVVIPDLQALCGFCDRDTAEICALHGTPDCPHRQG